MKIKNFIAANINEAMALVKNELGSEAVIISSATIDGQMHLTAAIEEQEEILFDEEERIEVRSTHHSFNDSLLRECLNYHGVLEVVQNRILSTTRQISKEQQIFSDTRLLEATLGCLFNYNRILDTSCRIKMFMGTPGSGKSTAIAKVATQAKMQGKNCAFVSTDNSKAGANKQLEAFANILEADFSFFKDERDLFNFCNEATNKYDFVLIDTPGINPFIEAEVAKVSRFSECIKADKFLTLDAGRNPFDAVEAADVFTQIGARNILPTRMDLTRRIGAVISAAACCGLSFGSASVSSSIAKGLAVVDNKSLAKLILA